MVKWVTESMRPFSIVKDKGFKMLSGCGSKGVQPVTENEADRSSFVLGLDSFGSSCGPSTRLGSGELLLSCVLAPLGPSSASLYSDVLVSVSGSESGKQKVLLHVCNVLISFSSVSSAV